MACATESSQTKKILSQFIMDNQYLFILDTEIKCMCFFGKLYCEIYIGLPVHQIISSNIKVIPCKRKESRLTFLELVTSSDERRCLPACGAVSLCF